MSINAISAEKILNYWYSRRMMRVSSSVPRAAKRTFAGLFLPFPAGRLNRADSEGRFQQAAPLRADSLELPESRSRELFVTK